MHVKLKTAGGREYILDLPHWNNEFVGAWLNQIFSAFANYPPDKGPQVPLYFTMEIS